MDDTRTWLELAVEQHKAGNLDLAEPLYRKVLAADPHHRDAMYLLGTLLLQRGNHAACIAALEPLAIVRPDIADVHNNLGIAYHALGRLTDATRSFRRAIKVCPNYDQAHFNLGVLLEQEGKPQEAEHCYRQALEINPDDAQVLCNLGYVLKAQARWDDADDCYSKLLNLRPESVEAAVNLGFVLVKQERLTAAEQVYKQVLIRQPDYAEIHSNLSYLYERQGKLAEAVVHAERAIAIKPDYAEAYNNLGTALRSMHRLDDASTAFRRAAELRPDFFLAEFNYGTTRLLAGDLSGGWPGYERRERTLEGPPRKPLGPRWNGESLNGKRLLIYADQGFGDTIQFVRYLPRVKQVSGAQIVLECQLGLHRLLERFPEIDELVEPGASSSTCSAEYPLLSLPAFFRTTFESIPADVPYLHADAALRDQWKRRLASFGEGKLRVGIAWQGNRQHGRDRHRSCRLAQFAPLAELSGVQLFSLQRDEASIAEVAKSAELGVVGLGSQFTDFAETAAVISELDLVISVDTAIAHLTGALGQATWILLPYSGDWRWLLDRSDTPWYPSARLFRQKSHGDWTGVIEAVAAELRNLAERSRS